MLKHGYNIAESGICDESTQTWFYKFNTRYVPDQYPPNEWSDASQKSLDLLGVSEQPLDLAHLEPTCKKRNLAKLGTPQSLYYSCFEHL